ncbi:MAG: CDP-alcohol phosphatidyltransferase family protein [Kofleriaceae bacterium]|jgi:phosphatidylglycerophosphate synthase|nr:CDP-alcohol phosphatidyltransferase family protein [Kofleriaceae bacterium]MBP6838168.1 CDP-alcohol phosphatidyltransferase family protein [Kofleriaceae bacterium]MBP9206345.1 CDP-alcohol phosphatidyltransferase family protein [Kofleriaceae bacterium]
MNTRPVSNLNPANAVTASRFLTLPPFVWAVDQGNVQLATLMLIVCGLLDLVDGAVAKLLRCQTPFGEVFDAIADGVCYGFFLVILLAYGLAPWPPVALVVVMGAANTAMRAAYSKRAGRTTNYRSFAMERLVAYSAYLTGFALARIEVSYFYWTFAGLMALVLLHDGKRMLLDPIEDAGPATTSTGTTPGGPDLGGREVAA